MRLHPRLDSDCHFLGVLAEGILLVHKNASVPWLILVPDTQAIALYQIDDERRRAIEDRWNALARWVHQRFDCARVNIAAIGNLVPQLHLHIVGRREDDAAWPGVVWGQSLPEVSWSEAELEALRGELKMAFPDLDRDPA